MTRRVTDRVATPPFQVFEVEKILQHASIDEMMIVLLGAEVGLRLHEMRRLTKDDVIAEGEQTYLKVPWPDQLREERRCVILVSDTLGRCLQWVTERGYRANQPLLEGSSTHLEGRFYRLCERAGLADEYLPEKRGLLSLRVTAGARQLLWGGRELLDITSRSSKRIYQIAAANLIKVDQNSARQYILLPPFPMPPTLPFPSPSTLRLLLEGEQDNAFIDLLSMALEGSPVTKKNVMSGWRMYLRWVREEGRGVLNADQAQAEAYAEWLKLEYQAPATINNRLVQVRKMYRLLLQGGLVETEVFKATHGVVNPADERRLYYTEEEITRLLAHGDVGERLLVLLGSHLGLTGPELLVLKFDDFRNDDQEVQLQRRLGKPVLSCSKEIQLALQQVRHREGERPLFGFHASGRVFEYENDMQLRSVVFMLCKKANVLYKGWRSFRNYAGIKMLRESRDARKTAEQLGIGGRQALNPTVRLVKKGEKK